MVCWRSCRVTANTRICISPWTISAATSTKPATCSATRRVSGPSAFRRDSRARARYRARTMIETDRQSEERGWETAKTLAEALPYIQVYDRETVVIKYGGHAMGESAVARQFAADVVLLKLMGVNPVVVHGGGPQISAMLDKAGVKSAFVDGLRVTDKDTMSVAEMVLSGAVNKEIAHWITVAGKEADVRGVGLSGKDAGLLTVEKTKRTKRDPDSMIEHEVDLGFVGE